MSMVLRLESSCVNLAVLINDYSTCCCYMLSNVVDFILLLDIYCFLFWVGRWYLLSTRVLYWPLIVIVFSVICGAQQTYRRLQLNRNSSQSSVHRISGWANASSLDWIFFFMSWCLEVLAWTRFLFMFSFLDTLSLSNLMIDVLVIMTSRFWE